MLAVDMGKMMLERDLSGMMLMVNIVELEHLME